MADDSAQQKTSPTLATTSAARMAAEALAFNPLSARVQEMLATTSAARMAAEALTFDPSKAMQKALLANPYESIRNAVSNFKVYEAPVDRTVRFLEDLHVDVPELVDYIDEHIDTAELEADTGPLEPEPAEDPILEAIWHYVARSDTWVRAKYQQYSEPAIRRLKYMAVLCIHGLLHSIASVLYMVYGTPGLGMSAVLLGTAKYIDDKTKATLKPETRGGLGITCRTCGAVPDMWCVTTKGNNPGTPARSLHAPRFKQ